jgi:hypothetical protein
MKLQPPFECYNKRPPPRLFKFLKESETNAQNCFLRLRLSIDVSKDGELFPVIPSVLSFIPIATRLKLSPLFAF